MQLHRTDKAKAELAAKERLLSVRERGALFLADGTKTRNEMMLLLQDTTGLLDKLVSEGYLAMRSSGQPAVTQVAVVVDAVRVTTAEMVASVQPPPAIERGSSDSFEGKRSLATTRMFLFDICERMFARKLPDLATQYRDQLREARDRTSMLMIADQMLFTVADIAGQERADGLSERIAMLLPLESLEAEVA
ncbi:MAG: hypothetical protein HYX42_20975 [Polaromonas sp.]|uniref:hypothetical protein n=1 Tax=Polaromonas sp. TaxID=1869339 RepID=UPI0025D60078|nr:hypothetical protein [Polaromonas sp.]MBI2728721.1 hypothetical protein [Polaromonas sp.]